MENNKNSFILRGLVSLGIVFFVVNSILFYMKSQSYYVNLTLFILLIVQTVIGISILIFPHEKKAYQFFLSLLFIGWGILNTLIAFLHTKGHNYLWPIHLILASIFMFLTGMKKYKRLKFGYVIPAIALFFMGIWFGLFAFGAIKVPFKTVIVLYGPAFMVFLGIILIVYFLIQKHHRKLVVIDENSGDFDDEELSFPKID